MSKGKTTNTNTKTVSNQIHKYFKKTTNTQFPQVAKKSKKINDQFYDDCLIENDRCDECSAQIESLQKQIVEAKEKIKKIEDAIKSCRLIISEKDSEIVNLQKKVPDALNHALAKSDQLMFQSFSSDFDSEQIRSLRSFSTAPRADATFISFAVKSLYAENPDIVKSKSACGRKYKINQNKEMMTPEKKKILENIFDERLRTIELSLIEKNTRQKRLNKLIKDAFTSISNSIESKRIVEEARRQLIFDE